MKPKAAENLTKNKVVDFIPVKYVEENFYLLYFVLVLK